MSFTLFLILTFILLGRPQDFVEALAPLRLAIVFTLLTAGVSFLENKKMPLPELLRQQEGKKYLLFYLMMIAGIPLALYRRAAFDHVFLLYLSNVLFFYYFIVHVDSVAKLKKVVFTITVSTALYSAFVLMKGSYSETGRLTFGTMYDPNDLAFLLISLFPLSISFLIMKESLLKKTVASAAIALSVITILLTASRGGFLALAGVFGMLLFTKGAGISAFAKWSLAATLVLLSLFMIHKVNTERYLSLKNIGSDYNVTGEEGRLGIWKKGILFVLKNPVTGIGVNCFPNAIGEQREAKGEAPKWQVAHNAYLQIAAEVGLIGFFLFFSLIRGAYKVFSFRGKEVTSADQQQLKDYGYLMQLSFIGCLITAFFLSQGYSVIFTLFFALAATIRRLSAEIGITVPTGEIDLPGRWNKTALKKVFGRTGSEDVRGPI